MNSFKVYFYAPDYMQKYLWEDTLHFKPALGQRFKIHGVIYKVKSEYYDLAMCYHIVTLEKE